MERRSHGAVGIVDGLLEARSARVHCLDVISRFRDLDAVGGVELVFA